jgi:hypothetical protein
MAVTRMRGERSGTGFYRFQNRSSDRVAILQYIIVPKPKNSKSLRDEPGIAGLVRVAIDVL